MSGRAVLQKQELAAQQAPGPGNTRLRNRRCKALAGTCKARLRPAVPWLGSQWPGALRREGLLYICRDTADRKAMDQATAEIAQTAARLVVEEGVEWGAAKHRALRQLGLPEIGRASCRERV